MVMLWLFWILVAIAVVAIIAVLIVDRRSGGVPAGEDHKRSRLPWSRWTTPQVAEPPRREAHSAGQTKEDHTCGLQ